MKNKVLKISGILTLLLVFGTVANSRPVKKAEKGVNTETLTNELPEETEEEDIYTKGSLLLDPKEEDGADTTGIKIAFADTLVKENNSMPKSFLNTQNNVIENSENLNNFFNKLTQGNRKTRIVHLGDSHLRGHVLPVVIRHRLEQAWGNDAVYADHITYQTSALAHETGKPGFIYHAWGKNGATCLYYCTEERIAQIKRLKPDLIILSFGTNEAHVRHYNALQHRLNLIYLIDKLRNSCPNAAIMLTTPQGSYFCNRTAHIRKVKKNGKTLNKRYYTKNYVINQNMPLCVKTIKDVAKEKNLILWNEYEIVGGAQFACLNWTGGNYLKSDRIHFNNAGYTLQGSLMAEALIKAYNQYLKKKTTKK